MRALWRGDVPTRPVSGAHVLQHIVWFGEPYLQQAGQTTNNQQHNPAVGQLIKLQQHKGNCGQANEINQAEHNQLQLQTSINNKVLQVTEPRSCDTKCKRQ